MWVQCVVDFWHTERNFGIVKDSKNRTYLLRRDLIEPDFAGRRYLVKHEPVDIQIKDGELVCAVRHFAEQEGEPDPEYVTVKSWNGSRGWAQREIGGDLYFEASDIVTEGIETLRVGSTLLVTPCPPPSSNEKCWNVKDVQICLEPEAELSEEGSGEL